MMTGRAPSPGRWFGDACGLTGPGRIHASYHIVTIPLFWSSLRSSGNAPEPVSVRHQSHDAMQALRHGWGVAMQEALQ
jgi:hypothetical protein